MHDETRAPQPVAAVLHLNFAGYRLDVHTNSLRLAARLQGYFRRFLDPAPVAGAAQLHAVVGTPAYDPAALRPWAAAAEEARAPKESWYESGGVRYILKVRTGVLVTLRPAVATISGALEEHANQVVNLIGTLFGLALLEQGYVMFHASAVVSTATGGALAFLGNSGSGKSSLALQLIERGGYGFLSNDRVLLRAEGGGVRACGLPKQPRVNPGTLLASAALSRLVPRPRLRIYTRLPREELWRLEDKTDVDVERELGARSFLAAPLERVYSLAWRPGGEGLAQHSLAPDAAVAALRTTAKGFGVFDLRQQPAAPEAAYARIAALAPFVGVSGRADPARLAARIAAGD